MSELKSCPFCGGDCEIALNTQKVFGTLRISYIPFCDNDECFMNLNEVGFETKKEAIEAWNRRVGEGEKG